MTVSLLILWSVCGLGAVVFATMRPVSGRAIGAAVVAFSAGAFASRLAPALLAVLVGCSAAAAAAIYLVRTPRSAYALAFAGLLSGVWSGVLARQGVSLYLAMVIAGGGPCLSAWLARRREHFAPASLRDEALMFVAALGVVCAAAPELADGWRAAISLNRGFGDLDATNVSSTPTWAVAVSAAALAAGAAASVWSRR